MQLSHMRFIKTSLPFTFSTMAASLMGAVDTAVVGHLGNYTYINAVSLGAVIFSTVYWLFGFLKISTSGFAAQAMGHHDPKLLAGAFLRGVLAAFAIGLVLVVLQEPIWRTALVLFNPDAATEPLLERYYRLLIWIMPLTLVFQTAQGWFAGSLHVRIAVLTALASNLINLVLDVLFVVVLNFEVTGVAAATCIANITGFLAILYFYWQHKPLPLTAVPIKEIFSGPICRQMVQCGSHLTVRMFCMIIMAIASCTKALPSAESFWQPTPFCSRYSLSWAIFSLVCHRPEQFILALPLVSTTSPCSTTHCASALSGQSALAWRSPLAIMPAVMQY